MSTCVRVQGGKLGGKGSAMQPDGSARLVGVSEVAATGDWLLDAFLRLATASQSLQRSKVIPLEFPSWDNLYEYLGHRYLW